MRRRGFLATVLLAFCAAFFLLLAGPRGAGEGAPPAPAEVAELSRLEATEALSGFRRGEILAAWGEPAHSSDAFSRRLVDWYDVPGGFVAVTYSAGESAEPVGPDTPGVDVLPVQRVEICA